MGPGRSADLARKPYAQPGSPYAEYIAEDIKYMSDRSMYKEPDEVTDAVIALSVILLLLCPAACCYP